MLGQGAPTYLFTQGATYSNLGTPAVGDFNGDGKLDVVGIGNAGLTIAVGAADGTFGPPTLSPSGTVTSIATADFNGDGRPDIIATMNPNLALFLSTGGGGYSSQTTVTAPGSITQMAVGDLNEDGRPDLLLGDSGQSLY